MLDIAFIRENAAALRQACKNKQLDASVVDEVLTTDARRRELQLKLDDLRSQANAQAEHIKKLVGDGGKPSQGDIAKGKAIKEQIKELQPAFDETNAAYEKAMLFVPNVPAEDVPIGANEAGNQVVKQVGTTPTFNFVPKEHFELMENLGWLDTERAVRIGGFRSYFLKGDAVLWEQALMRLALDLLVKEGFTPMTAPVLVNEDMMWGTGYFPWGSEDHYKTQDNQILAGTAEVALTAYRAGETLLESELPYKMVGISPCFRREVGSYGKDLKGVIRVHQFTKVEQVVYTVADETETRIWHEKMLGYSEKLLETLGLSYQVLLMCSGDMGAGQRKKFDVETWFPGQQKYRETHSASYFNDFQSRRLGIRYRSKDGTLKHVYTLNNTVAASPRLLAAVIENYQKADGTIEVPTALQKWL
ncbi:serine--tRNA ligase [Candidatus Woesebacteria bacterium]|nr:serine--tRNA ligase [Candidatus Woesebacteria bacterium]